MFRTFLMAAALAALPVLSPCSLLAQQAPPPSAGAGHKAMTWPKPVNLKVLPKDTSPEDLFKMMRGFSQQLGVHCGFCHAEGTPGHPDFASDEKPDKNIARTMISMTQEINTKYLSQIHDPDAAPDQKTVTCGTCHQGHTMPMPFKPQEHPGSAHPGMDHSNTDHPNTDHPAAPPQP